MKMTKRDDDKIISNETSLAFDENGTKRLFNLILRNRFSIIIGILATCVSGLWIPIYAVLVGDFTAALKLINQGKSNTSNYFVNMFLITGSLILVASVGSRYFLGRVASFMSHDLRLSEFKSMISKPIPWFENPDNNVGSIIMKITSNIDLITDYVADKFPALIQNVTALISCIILAFYQSWKLTLVVLTYLPVVFITAFFESKSGKANHKSGSNMAKMTIEIMESFKTIISFNLQDHFITKFDKCLESMRDNNVANSKKRAFLVSGSKASLPLVIALTFFAGSYFVSTGDLKYDEFLKVMEGIVLVCFVISQDSIDSFGK